ncbi:hypothetical protein PS9374_07015 [Planomonospora sphaerica]|uniref:Lipoprotein n=1 Tax=Planomonospora sphaerica TaxID=161355 RepID=A0A171DQI2_9ACTN|nr:hypothetical protein [Planomonospora sphaerica]GAT71324.1 hypothetical protein PS9374_07015 [Planomonospora sphaerica]
MRRMLALLTPLVLLALLSLASCDDGRMNAAEFRDRARQIASRWHGSTADRAWRDGLVPLRGWHIEPDWQRMPDWVAVSETNSAWALHADLPGGSPPPAVLRWPDGSTLAAPLISAAAAYAELTAPKFAEEECPAKGCRLLRVTGVELGQGPMATSRGMLQIPAWHFTVAGVPARFSVPAVDPAVVTARPTAEDDGVEEVTSFEAAADDPRRVRLRYGHGQCDAIHGARIHESAEVVVVDVDTEFIGEWCTLMLVHDEITVALDAPVGDRIVLDAESGLPVLPTALAPH